jgi:DNA-binding NarL/FixJ family response regulator
VSGIRTVVVTMPAMLRDLIGRLAQGRVELEIVAELKARHALARRLGELRPDLVVIGLRGNENDAVIRNLLAAVPTAKIIAFPASGRAARGFELRLCRTDLGDAPPEGLVDFIRGCSVSFETEGGTTI